MDADNFPVRQATPAQGGTVEPANRASVAIERFQTPNDTTGERYECATPSPRSPIGPTPSRRWSRRRATASSSRATGWV